MWQVVNNVNQEKAKKVPLLMRSPFIEFEGLIKGTHYGQGHPLVESVKQAEVLESPRVIKSHLPLEFLPPNLLETCKVIFVCRNPKDCCVSFYHHYQTLDALYQFTGDFKDFSKMFLEGQAQFGSYWTMLKVCIAFILQNYKFGIWIG